MMPRHFGLPPKEPVEIVKISAPVLAEIVAVMIGIALGLAWMIIAATRVSV